MSSGELKLTRAIFAIIFGLGVFTVNDVTPRSSGWFVTSAYAIIGRPLTPMSYAGVARRTTARTYAYGAGAAYGAAAAGAAAYGAAVVARPGCVQVVNPYGGWTWRCY
jgi:hypothetical protein